MPSGNKSIHLPRSIHSPFPFLFHSIAIFQCIWIASFYYLLQFLRLLSCCQTKIVLSSGGSIRSLYAQMLRIQIFITLFAGSCIVSSSKQIIFLMATDTSVPFRVATIHLPGPTAIPSPDAQCNYFHFQAALLERERLDFILPAPCC